MDRRRLGNSELYVSSVALGCWPIAGMTSGGVTDVDSLATIDACFDLGINFLDTAYCYGQNGESERLIARALRGRRGNVVLATKCGIHFAPGRRQVIDGRPERLKRECEESLARLGTDYVDVLYLHAPDPAVPIADSAGALSEMLEAGKTRSIGASNVSAAQLESFISACPLVAYQPPYNMLLRDIEVEILPWCIQRNISVVVYWPLMKGLLAGKIPREHVFPTTDSRLKYPMFQGEEWRKNHDLIDELKNIAAECGKTVAQLVINWTIVQPGVTSALCGAKRPDQIRDNAGAAGWALSPELQARVDTALARRGQAISRWAV